MPDPKPDETKDEFMKRCIPVVIADGTAKDGNQAVPVCMSMWEKAHKSYSIKKAYPWDECIRDQTERYGSEEIAKKVCGMIKAKYGGSPTELPSQAEFDRFMVVVERELDIKPQKSWITVDEMRGWCPSCAEKMIAKGLDRVNVMALPLEFELKTGARHSANDQGHIDQAVDHLIQAGGDHPSMHPTEPPMQPHIPEVWEFALPKSIAADETMIAFGGEVKALGDGRIGGIGIRFTDADHKDLTGEYFAEDTYYGKHEGDGADVMVHHGFPVSDELNDPELTDHMLQPAQTKRDKLGIWAETICNMADDYEKYVYDLVSKGKLYWSSGTAGHALRKTEDGKITRWPIVEWSLTPQPAESQNHVMTLKSFIQSPQSAETEDGSTVVEAQAALKSTNLETLGVHKMEITTEIQQVIDATSKSAADEAVKGVLSKLPTNQFPGSVIQQNDPADIPFQKMGDQLGAVKQATLTQGRELAPRLKALNLKALGANELIGSEGGFLLEPSFAAQLLTPLHDAGPFSSRADKLAIGPNANGVTVRGIDETSRGTGSRWGGIVGYRLAEAGTKLPSYPTFRLIEMRLKKYAVLCYATDELLQDTTALAGIIQQGCSEELDFMVNDDIFEGPGAAGPLGIMNSGALVSVTKESGQKAATLMTENVIKMWARMHPRSKGNSAWFINTDVTPQLYTMSLSVGTGGMPMFMMPGSLPNAPSGSLLGRPVVETEFNSTLGTKGDIVLADMTQYAMIDRDVAAASSIHVQFLTDQVAYRFVYRCDGQSKIAVPLTPYKGTGNTLSPFVTLDTRA